MLLLILAAQAAPLSSGEAVCADGRRSVEASAPCPRSVFFDSGEALEIRRDWNTVLDEVARELGQRGGRVRLDSFTDRSGPAAANRRVSEQRGDSVRRALLERGVPSGAITTMAHGETQPLIATPDGVREPQNRRVDITLIP